MNPAKDRGVFLCPDFLDLLEFTGESDRVIVAGIGRRVAPLVSDRN
jgi:hypothetical protein